MSYTNYKEVNWQISYFSFLKFLTKSPAEPVSQTRAINVTNSAQMFNIPITWFTFLYKIAGEQYCVCISGHLVWMSWSRLWTNKTKNCVHFFNNCEGHGWVFSASNWVQMIRERERSFIYKKKWGTQSRNPKFASPGDAVAWSYVNTRAGLDI